MQISLSELQSNFDGVRLPTSCPSPAAPLKVTVDSYNDPTPRDDDAAADRHRVLEAAVHPRVPRHGDAEHG